MSDFVKSMLFLSLLFSVPTYSAVLDSKAFSDVRHADLDRDGKFERIEVNSRNDRALQVWRGKKLIWSAVPASWHPWKLQIADVDGDERSEIVVGVFKATKFFPRPHNCLFIYSWVNDQGHPKWLGSSLARPFTDFLFADLDRRAGDELIAIETAFDRNMSVASYRWNGFGFTLDTRTGSWRTAKLISAAYETIQIEADGSLINAFTSIGGRP